MDTIQNIKQRISLRQYSDREITQQDLHTILEAAMAGPSCVNARDWSFLVVRDRETLNKMADANGRPADPLRGCQVGILVCGDLERAFPPAPDYWVIDGAIAAQKGTWPQMERVEAQRELFHLPETQMPHSIIAFGYPAETVEKEKQLWEDSRVHYEHW